MDGDLSWKGLRLSLERLYKDDSGEPIPALFDITPDGEHVYEPKHDPSKRLGERLRRIFSERGVDFFEGDAVQRLIEGTASAQTEEVYPTQDKIVVSDMQEIFSHNMTPEGLFKMRMEILPQLYVALGEMSHAKDLLTLLLSSTSASASQLHAETSAQSSGTATLTATIVTKPPPIPSVQAFNRQLVIGSKDESLRKASDLFRSAANTVERGRIRGETYWADALRMRRANWGLIPAPLPFGSATGKGADKTSKDFLVSFGLEESPATFRRRAVGHIPTLDLLPDAEPLVFPLRQRTRLRVSFKTSGSDGDRTVTRHNLIDAAKDGTLDGCLRSAQQEVVEQEIFSILVREAPNLLTATARVSERLIVVEVVQNIELIFELVDSSATEASAQVFHELPWKCDLIYAALHVLLLRLHVYYKEQRLGATGIAQMPAAFPVQAPPVLQPIIDFLQYEVFCKRVKAELERAVAALTKAGIHANLRISPVGESGHQLAMLLSERQRRRTTGEAVVRIDKRFTIRLTFASPSTLTAHLSQATLAIPSIPQLCQLLSNEIERYLLRRLCELGSKLCEGVKGTWFVDEVKGRSVGRWEGCVLNLQVQCAHDFDINCTALRLIQDLEHAESLHHGYTPQDDISLLVWAEGTIRESLVS